MTPILERDEYLAKLLAAADLAANGRGQIVLLAGEAGSGKSRLIDRFLVELPQGTIAAQGICERFYTPRPLGPLFDMAPSLGTDFHRALQTALAGPDPYAELVEAVRALGSGVVLVFEDAHCADGPTLDVLKFLCHRVAALEALIVITYRNDEVSPDAPFTRLLGDFPSRYTSRLALEGLSHGGIEQLAQSLNVAAHGIFTWSGGNPLLAIALLEHSRTSSTCLPPSLVQFAAARLALLDPQQKEWLKWLALCPHGVDRSLLEQLSDTNGLQLDQTPVWSGFLVEAADGSLSFRHEIMREALLAGLPASERRNRLARLLELACADRSFAEARAALVAGLGADAGNAELAVEFFALAARQAEERGDFDEAVQFLFRALPLAEQLGAEQHAVMLERWACRASMSDGVTGEMLAAVEEANSRWQRLGETLPLARNHLLLCRLHRHRADRQQAEAHISEAIGLLEGHANSAEQAVAFALCAQMIFETGAIDAAHTKALAAARTARAVGDPATRVDAWVTIARVLLHRAKPRGMALLAASRIIAERDRLHEVAARISASQCDQTLAAMDMQGAESWIEGELGSVKANAPPCWRAGLEGREALVLVHQGRLREAELQARAVLASNRASAAMQFPATLALGLARSRLQTGDAMAVLNQAADLAAAIGDFQAISMTRLALIEHAFMSGRGKDAQALCEAAESSATAHTGNYAEKLLQLWRSHPHMTGEHIVNEHGSGKHKAAERKSGPKRCAAGRLAATADPADAANDLAANGYPFESALAKLFVTGRDGSQMVGEAVAEFTALGANAGLACARRIAQARGIAIERVKRKRGPYRAARAHPLGLTRREVDILRMIVNGNSNREIAEELGRSLRTVEHHVSAILGKMHLESRVQAALHAVTTPGILDHTEESH